MSGSLSTSSPADFTISGYLALIQNLVEHGYRIASFKDLAPTGHQLILRHDLDMSIDAAISVAETEHYLGVSATYFVLLRSEMYNPFSQRGRSALLRIAALGHEIGLHLDASLYEDSVEALNAAAQSECSALEAIINQPVGVISFHRPAPSLRGLDRKIAGRRHTYEPAFFSDIGYCSDSRGGWHHGHPLDHEAVTGGKSLQLLTHPIWWVAAPDETVRQKLDRFALGRFDLLRAELAANCDAYPQEFRATGVQP